MNHFTLVRKKNQKAGQVDVETVRLEIRNQLDWLLNDPVNNIDSWIMILNKILSRGGRFKDVGRMFADDPFYSQIFKWLAQNFIVQYKLD